MATSSSKDESINNDAAFKLGNNILELWGCSDNEKQAILGLTKGSYSVFMMDNKSVTLSSEQLERISYVTNIHASLSLLFSNRANVESFMSMKNNNSYFSGNSPLSLIASGNLGNLYEVFKRIDGMLN